MNSFNTFVAFCSKGPGSIDCQLSKPQMKKSNLTFTSPFQSTSESTSSFHSSKELLFEAATAFWSCFRVGFSERGVKFSAENLFRFARLIDSTEGSPTKAESLTLILGLVWENKLGSTSHQRLLNQHPSLHLHSRQREWS